MICRAIVFIENESTARKIRSRAPRTRVDHGGFGSFAMTLRAGRGGGSSSSTSSSSGSGSGGG